MAKVWTTMGKTAEGRYQENGFHTSEPDNWYRCFTVDDPQEFIAHMRRFTSLPKRPLSRAEYEQICSDYGIAPAAEEHLAYYGTNATIVRTNNYLQHTDPENREFALANTLHGLRYRGQQRQL